MPSMKRTQLQRVHITSECVRAESARKRTPRRRSPFETPVAATITSPGASSSVMKTRVGSSIPASRACSISRRDVGQSCACSSPPRQRSAAADMIAWRVPPMPTARWSFVPRIAAEINTVTVQSWISLMRAPDARMSSIRSWWRGRSRTIVVMSFGRLPNASAIACTFSPIGFSRSIEPRARGPTAIFRMYMSGRFRREPRSPTAIIDIAPLPPRATTPRPSSGSTARSTASPPAPITSPTRTGDSSSTEPITIRPSMGKSSSTARIASAASRSAASWSARPSQRAAVSAAPSVTRTYCSQRQRRPTGGASSAVESASSTVLATLHPFYLFNACEHQLQHGVDRRADVRVRDDGDAVTPGAANDVILDAPDVVEAVDVLRMRAETVEADVPHHEVRAVLFLVVDREHALHDEGTLDAGEHPWDEMDTLEHHRPAFFERALDRGADADEHVARLLEEAGNDRVLCLLGLAETGGGLEARVVDRRHQLLREEGAHRLTYEVGRRHPRDAQSVRGLGRNRRLTRAGRAADED